MYNRDDWENNRKAFGWSLIAILVTAALGLLLVCCTPAQNNWKNSITVDVSLDGEYENTELLYQSLGVSFPLRYGIWASTGIWTDRFQSTGTYWGVSYSFYPSSLFK